MPRHNAGWFRRGHDPRRHVLTTAERRKGFHAACRGKGIAFTTWLRNRVASTARPSTVAAYKRQWLASRTVA